MTSSRVRPGTRPCWSCDGGPEGRESLALRLLGGRAAFASRQAFYVRWVLLLDGRILLALGVEPTVSPGLAAGPFLFPGWPAIPAPEFCALGAAETSGLVVCASAAGPVMTKASAARLTINLMTCPPRNCPGFHSLRTCVPIARSSRRRINAPIRGIGRARLSNHLAAAS